MTMVTLSDLETAREWLEINDGQDGESEACQRVADFLAKEVSRRINESAIRKAARRHNVPLRLARQAAKAKP